MQKIKKIEKNLFGDIKKFGDIPKKAHKVEKGYIRCSLYPMCAPIYMELIRLNSHVQQTSL